MVIFLDSASNENYLFSKQSGVILSERKDMGWITTVCARSLDYTYIWKLDKISLTFCAHVRKYHMSEATHTTASLYISIYLPSSILPIYNTKWWDKKQEWQFFPFNRQFMKMSFCIFSFIWVDIFFYWISTKQNNFTVHLKQFFLVHLK